MYEWFLKIKEEKKWLFYLLILPFLAVFAYEMYNKFLLNDGKEIVDKAEEEDEKIKKQQQKAEIGAEFHKEEAERIEKELKESTDKDWHLK